MTTRISVENREIVVVDSGKSICTGLREMDDNPSLRNNLVELGIFSIKDESNRVVLTLIRDKIGEVFNARDLYALRNDLTCIMRKPSVLNYETVERKSVRVEAMDDNSN